MEGRFLVEGAQPALYGPEGEVRRHSSSKKKDLLTVEFSQGCKVVSILIPEVCKQGLNGQLVGRLPRGFSFWGL